MATNTFTLTFQPCEPTPAEGYRISYRPLGTEGAYRIVQVTGSPAVIVDTLDAAGTQYEGFIQGDCGNEQLGPRNIFATATESPSDSGSPEPPASLRVVNNLAFVSITGVWTIPSTGGPIDAREASVDGGYPVPPGTQVDATIHPDHDGDSNLDVIVYFSSAVFGDTTARVTDSDSVNGCGAGTFVAVIGVTGAGSAFRLNNAETWQVLVSNVPC